MNSNVWSWVVLCLLGTGAGFHDASSLSAGLGAPRVVLVTVRDAAGSPWPVGAVPRQVRLELTLASSPSEQRSTLPLYLVPGLASEELIADLADPPLREDTSARRVPMTVDRARQRAVAIPSQPLSAGSQYSLVWISS